MQDIYTTSQRKQISLCLRASWATGILPISCIAPDAGFNAGREGNRILQYTQYRITMKLGQALLLSLTTQYRAQTPTIFVQKSVFLYQGFSERSYETRFSSYLQLSVRSNLIQLDLTSLGFSRIIIKHRRISVPVFVMCKVGFSLNFQLYTSEKATVSLSESLPISERICLML